MPETKKVYILDKIELLKFPHSYCLVLKGPQIIQPRIYYFIYDYTGCPISSANIYFKSRNLSNIDTQNYSTDLR